MTERDSLRLEMVSAATMASRDVSSCSTVKITTVNKTNTKSVATARRVFECSQHDTREVPDS